MSDKNDCKDKIKRPGTRVGSNRSSLELTLGAARSYTSSLYVCISYMYSVHVLTCICLLRPLEPFRCAVGLHPPMFDFHCTSEYAVMLSNALQYKP